MEATGVCSLTYCVVQATLSQYFGSRHCLSCKSLCSSSICEICLQHPVARQKCAVKLNSEVTYTDRRLAHINQVLYFITLNNQCLSFSLPIMLLVSFCCLA